MCKENSFFADVRDETRWPPSASLETFDFKRPLGMTRDLFIFLLDVFGFKVKWNGWANIVRFFYCCVESYKVGPNCGVMDNGHCVLGLRLSLLSYFLIDLQLDDDEFGCVTVGGAHAIHLYTDIITKHMVFFLSLSSYLKQHPPTFFLTYFFLLLRAVGKKKEKKKNWENVMDEAVDSLKRPVGFDEKTKANNNTLNLCRWSDCGVDVFLNSFAPCIRIEIFSKKKKIRNWRETEMKEMFHHLADLSTRTHLSCLGWRYSLQHLSRLFLTIAS